MAQAVQPLLYQINTRVWLTGVSGALMIGMSTAVLMSAFQDVLQKMTRTRHR